MTQRQTAANKRTTTKTTKKKSSSRSTRSAKGTRRSTTSTKKMASKTKANRTTKYRKLHMISDFTGNLANHIVSSVLSQFPDPKIEKVFHLFTDREDKLMKALKQVRRKSDLVVHAVVSPVQKQMIEDHCNELGIGCMDLTGSISNFFSQQLDLKASNDPNELHKIDSDYFKRIDAMEFTLQHDDSRRLDSIDQAEVVLLGISRVSKSPTSTFLGSLGYKTANVSIAPSLGLPKELKGCRGTVCALTMQPSLLYEIRQRRFEINGIAQQLASRDELSIGYLNPRDVAREVMEAESLYRKNRIPVVDVTGMTIEESAAHVLQALKLVRGH